MDSTTVESLLNHQSWMQTLARSLVQGSGEADDLVQETWASYLSKPPRSDRSLKPWLKTVLVNHWRQSGRKAKLRQHQPGAERLASPGVEPADMLAKAQAHRAVVEEVLAMPDRDRDLLLLRYFDGRSSAQIARQQGRRADAIRQQLKRALEKLRGRLEARYGGKENWLAAVLPLALPKGVPLAAASLSRGGTFFSQGYFLAAVLLVVLAGAYAWFAWNPGEEGPGLPPENGAEYSAQASDIQGQEEASPISGERNTLPTTSEKLGQLQAKLVQENGGQPAANVEVHFLCKNSNDGEYKTLKARSDQAGLISLNAGKEWTVRQILIFPSKASAGRSIKACRIPFTSPAVVPLELRVFQGVEVKGRVLDAEKRPVVAAKIEARWQDQVVGVTESDASGNFSLHHLGEGTTLSARKASQLNPYLLELGKVPIQGVVDEVELVLAQTFPLQGKVVDADGQPVAGVRIQEGFMQTSSTDHPWLQTRSRGVQSVASDGNGDFNFDLVPQGPTQLDFFLSDSFRAAKRLRVDVGAKPVLLPDRTEIPKQGAWLIYLPSLIKLSGKVLDPQGSAVAGARVQWDRSETETDRQGLFQLSILPSQGPKPITVLAEGFAAFRTEELSREVLADFYREIVLQEENLLMGKVVDEEGKPWTGVPVRIENQDEKSGGTTFTATGDSVKHTLEYKLGIDLVQTDREGAFRFPHLRKAEYRIWAKDLKNPSTRVERKVTSGEKALRLLLPRSQPAVVSTANFSGRVFHAESREPIPNFSITLSRDGTADTADDGLNLIRNFLTSDGQWQAGGFQPGVLEISVKAPGYASQTIREQEFSAGEHEFEFGLLPARNVRVVVQDAQGNPLPGAKVSVLDHNSQPIMLQQGMGHGPTLKTDEQGGALLSGLPAGMVQFQVEVYGRARTWSIQRDLRVQPTAPVVLVLDSLQRSSTVSVGFTFMELPGPKTDQDEPGKPSRINFLQESMELEFLTEDGANLATSTFELLEDGEFQIRSRWYDPEQDAYMGSGGRSPFPSTFLALPAEPVTMKLHRKDHPTLQTTLHLSPKTDDNVHKTFFVGEDRLVDADSLRSER